MASDTMEVQITVRDGALDALARVSQAARDAAEATARLRAVLLGVEELGLDLSIPEPDEETR